MTRHAAVAIRLAVLLAAGCGAQPTGGGSASRSDLPVGYVKPSPPEFVENCWWLTYNDVDSMIIRCADEARDGRSYEAQRAELDDEVYLGCLAAGWDSDYCWDEYSCLLAILDAVYHQ